MDFGECLTIHKSQGSQWDHVGIVWHRALWGAYYKDKGNWKRLLYTALTRSSDNVKLWVL